MEIRLATQADFNGILPYDRHIPHARLADCIHNNHVYVLWDGEKVQGILRYNLFWQTIPFLDLMIIDEAYRNQGWGKRMMAYWETSLVHMGYTYAMLSTQADETAKYFYEKLTYRKIGAFLPPDQEADEIMYGKDLAQ